MTKLPATSAAASALASTSSSTFDTWAPERSPWSAWTKPVLFSHLDDARILGQPPALPSFDVSTLLGDWLGGARAAFVIDLPGVAALAAARALAERGVRPVLLHNGTNGENAIVDVKPLVLTLRALSEAFASLSLPHDAPPAFVLDDRRMAQLTPLTPGRFDNRWMVLPQDFPSGHVLKEHGVTRAVVVAPGRTIATDLQHVVLRWQELGVAIYATDESMQAAPTLVQVQKPSRFRAIFHTWKSVVGLRRNAAGGFGSVIPEPSQGGGS